MNSRVGAYWLLFIACLAAAYASLKAYQSANSPIPRPEPRKALEGPPLRNFELTDQENKTFDSKSLDGKVWIGSFFFTSCPSTCLKMNQVIAQIDKDYAGRDLHFVSISCDPEIDTPEVLEAYAAKFKASPDRWSFVTGPFEYTSKLGADRFLISVEKQSHSDRLVVFDQAGKVRGRYRATDPAEVTQMKQLLDRLLNEDHESSKTTTEPPALEMLKENVEH